MEKILDTVNSPEDIKKLDNSQINQLAKEIRGFLLNSISKTGGHLASNLGVVELTLALHRCFSTPKDKIIWDVGHQAYVHKMLTGRKNDFVNLRQFHGLSGFPKPYESVHDMFITGHSSTSISSALGMAKARDIKGDDNSVIAVIGDGSMTGGIAYEALNNAGRANTNLIVVLNDNQMSISTNVGAVSRHLNDIRTEPAYLGAKEGVHNFLKKIPMIGKPIDKAIEKAKDGIKYIFVSGIMFEELGFKYIGPIDGHNITELENVFNKVKKMKGPIIVHVHTTKGKGYKYAEKLPWEYHGVGTFDIKTGKPISNSTKKSYSDVFGDSMIEMAVKYKNLVAISAAMTSGTGLDKFEAKYPNRFFDVAIAEQHAVTFSAGLATSGLIPVFAVYSTFLQRAYDQIVHDVCLQNLHVIFAIDRAGIVGADGETHQGVFDTSYLSHIPNMTLIAPKNGVELKSMLEFAVNFKGPIAIRYPRGNASEILDCDSLPIEYGKSELIYDGTGIAVISAGCMIEVSIEVCEKLKAEGYKPMLVNARFLKPVDGNMLEEISKKCRLIFTLEDNLRSGGFGSKVLEELNGRGINGIHVHNFAFPDTFIEQGTRNELFEKYGLDKESIYNNIKSIIMKWMN